MLVFSNPLVLGLLSENPLGSPQDFVNVTGIDLCSKRSSLCSVLLDVPPGCAGASSGCPIVFCLHGMGGKNKGYVEQCGQPIHSRNHWIGVYPQGDPLAYRADKSLVTGWNDGQSVDPSRTLLRCKYDDFNCTLDPNDGTFIATMIAGLKAMGAAGHVYLFGQSNGADLSQRLASNAGPAMPIAGIAAQSSQMDSTPARSAAGPFNRNQPPTGGQRLAQLSIHGTADACIPYNGGPKFDSSIFELYSESVSNAAWATHNGCTGSLASTNVSLTYIPQSSDYHEAGVPATQRSTAGAEPPVGSGTATHWVWGGCPPTAPVEHYQSHGAGHIGTLTLREEPLVDVVLDFFEQVEAAFTAAGKQQQVEDNAR